MMGSKIEVKPSNSFAHANFKTAITKVNRTSSPPKGNFFFFFSLYHFVTIKQNFAPRIKNRRI
uniref:Protein yippee-like At4g27745 n=1 Tax=Rhizophora mucronata TaxID=61149 RepID=A0A2P2LTT2_RHIMU